MDHEIVLDGKLGPHLLKPESLKENFKMDKIEDDKIYYVDEMTPPQQILPEFSHMDPNLALKEEKAENLDTEQNDSLSKNNSNKIITKYLHKSSTKKMSIQEARAKSILRLKIPWNNIDNPCIICYKQLTNENCIVLQPCKHIFCKTCILELKKHSDLTWSKNFVCPLCRTKIRRTSILFSRSVLLFIVMLALLGFMISGIIFVYFILLPL